MEEMDVDGNGYVELPEFEAWWSRHGGDLETHRDRAFTLVFEGGLELLRGGGHCCSHSNVCQDVGPLPASTNGPRRLAYRWGCFTTRYARSTSRFRTATADFGLAS